jgi:acylphosphatase
MAQMRLRISGRVQGVFYRAWCKQVADNMNVPGWVKNEADGSVTVVAVGTKERLEQFIKKLKEGSRHALVDEIQLIWEKEEPFESFEVRYE